MKNKEIFQFLGELRSNNNREWFQANKERHDALRKAFIAQTQVLIDRIASFDPALVGLEAKDCLFRIYRDIRFSPDKTPYKTHFAAYLSKGGRASERAGYYIHLEPGNCLLSGGVWCPPQPLLKRLRMDIYDHIDEFMAIMEEPAFKARFPVLEGESLKRMPAGYPADFKYGEILRHKDFSVASYQPDEFFLDEDWIDKAVNLFKQLLPLNDFLNYTVDEVTGGL